MEVLPWVAGVLGGLIGGVCGGRVGISIRITATAARLSGLREVIAAFSRPAVATAVVLGRLDMSGLRL